jgi:hypothetical protein
MELFQPQKCTSVFLNGHYLFSRYGIGTILIIFIKAKAIKKIIIVNGKAAIKDAVYRNKLINTVQSNSIDKNFDHATSPPSSTPHPKVPASKTPPAKHPSQT